MCTCSTWYSRKGVVVCLTGTWWP